MSIETEAEITGVMELVDRDLHIAIINMLKNFKENMNTIRKGTEIILKSDLNSRVEKYNI